MRFFLFIISYVFLLSPFYGKSQNIDNPDSLKVRAEKLIALVKETTDDPQKRYSFAVDAIKCANLTSDRHLQAKALLGYGQASVHVNKFNEAIDSANKALDIFVEFNDSISLAKAYNMLGTCYLRKANYDKAISYLEQSSKISRKLKDSLSLASSYNSMGIVFYNSGRFADAKEYFTEALNIYKNLKEDKNSARILGNIGLIFLEEGNSIAAMTWFEQSLSIRLQVKDTFMLASIYDNIGNAQEKMGNLDRSLEYYKLSNEYFRKKGSRHGIALSSIAMARVQVKLGNLNEAYKNIKEGQTIALKDQEEDLAMQSYRLLSDYYLKVKRYEQSRAALEKYLEYFEKSFNEKTTSRIAELRVQLETAQNEKDNQLLKAKVEMQQLQAKQSNRLKTILSISAGLLFILLSVTLYFVYQLRNKNKEINRINKQLFQFNDELEKLVKDRTKDLSYALEKVQELEKVKSAFLSNISHEVRTPLNGILGFTQYLLSPNVPEEDKQQYGRLVQKLGNRLLRVVEDIVELSKIETNQLELHYTDYNINDLLGELYISYSNNEDFLAKNLNFRFIKSLPDSQAFFSVDVYRVRKIMAHLIENAFKFTNSGSIEFGYFADSSSTLKFFVKDTGIGIPKKIQNRVFERFFKHIAEDHIAIYEGTGVGLTIAKGFAIAMGGRIEVESIPNHGSTFYLYIPKKTPEKSINNVASEPVKSWKNKTILVVEDDLISYQYIEALMHRTEARLIHVKNAEDAIEVCNINKNINLILLDIQLPFMNGIEATRIIRQINKRVPIITQTANTINDEGKACLDAGCNAFIAKPIDPDELFLLINNLIL